jgi:hypothetical protein
MTGNNKNRKPKAHSPQHQQNQQNNHHNQAQVPFFFGQSGASPSAPVPVSYGADFSVETHRPAGSNGSFQTQASMSGSFAGNQSNGNGYGNPAKTTPGKKNTPKPRSAAKTPKQKTPGNASPSPAQVAAMIDSVGSTEEDRDKPLVPATARAYMRYARQLSDAQATPSRASFKFTPVTAYTSDDELDLIDMSLQDEVKGSAPSRNVLEHDLKAAPVLTRSVLTAFRTDGYFPQYGL